MERQRERARASAAFGAEAEESAKLYGELSTQIRPPEFLGYESLATPARVPGLRVAGHRLREAAAGGDVEVMLDRTPCYAESGGQIGDTGQLVGRQGRGRILDTYYRGSGLIVHRVHVEQGGLREGEDVAVSVESPRRQGLRLHHTGTHLLHAALRRVLGTHVTQAGSLVAPDHLRFDVTHPSQIRDRELEQVGEMVNEKGGEGGGGGGGRGAPRGQIGGVAGVAARVDGLDQDGLRAVVDSVRDRLGSGGICLGGVEDDKVNLVAAVSKDLTPRFNAGKLIQEVARAVGGGGGGRPDLAQAGGKDPSKLDAALGLVHDWVGRSTST